jgi:hypothetical protein
MYKFETSKGYGNINRISAHDLRENRRSMDRVDMSATPEDKHHLLIDDQADVSRNHQRIPDVHSRSSEALRNSSNLRRELIEKNLESSAS